LQNSERSNDSLIAPELILVECGQVLNKKRTQKILIDEELNALLDSLLDLPIRLFAHSDLLRPACDLAVELNLTVYDALFLALVKRYNALLCSQPMVGYAMRLTSLICKKIAPESIDLLYARTMRREMAQQVFESSSRCPRTSLSYATLENAAPLRHRCWVRPPRIIFCTRVRGAPAQSGDVVLRLRGGSSAAILCRGGAIAPGPQYFLVSLDRAHPHLVRDGSGKACIRCTWFQIHREEDE